jgi:hypothetical protein
MDRRLAPITLSLVLAAGCTVPRHPRVADIKYDPARYEHHAVTVSGVVTNSWAVPFFPVKLYKVDDGSGELTVVSHDGPTPPKGSRVSVRGRVTELATLGGTPVGLHLEQEHVRSIW